MFRRVVLVVLMAALGLTFSGVQAQDKLGAPLKYGDVFFGTLDTQHAVMLWVFNGKASDQITLTVTRLSDTLVPDVTLSQVQSSKGAPPTTTATLSADKTTAAVTLTLPEDSPYQIKVHGANATAGEYRLTLASDTIPATAPTAVPPQPTAVMSNLSASYHVLSTSLMDSSQPSTITEGVLTVSPVKSHFVLTWDFGPSRITGIAVPYGKGLAVAIGDQDCTLGIYRLNDRDGLDGTWLFGAKPITSPGTEHLSRLGAYQKGKLEGDFTVAGVNNNGGKPYRGTVKISDWGSYYSFGWRFGNDSIRGEAITLDDALIVVSGDPAGKLNCGPMVFTLKADGSLEGMGKYYYNFYWNLSMKLVPESTSGTKTAIQGEIAGNYTVTRQDSSAKAAQGQLSVKPNWLNYDLVWNFGGPQDALAMRWGDTLVSSSGSKDCLAIIQAKLKPDSNEEEAVFGQLGKAMDSPGWVRMKDLTESNKPKLGYYSVSLLNPNDQKFIDGYLELADRGGSLKTIWTFGTNTYEGVGLKMDNLLVSVLPLKQGDHCTLRAVQFKDDGSFEGKETSTQDSTLHNLSGTIAKR
jgi:hypothetical protein